MRINTLRTSWVGVSCILIFCYQFCACFLLSVSVEWLVVDESDKLFEEGKTGFRDQVCRCFIVY